MAVIWMGTGRFAPDYDTDAQAYITAVEAADAAAGQSGGLESGVKNAINAFVVGCKADGIWSAIKASCILAGARTLNGCLVPLVGTAPTNFNFVAGDYNRETGLKGDGSTKYLNSNRANNADPQDSNHVGTWASETFANNTLIMAGSNPSAPGNNAIVANASTQWNLRSRNSTADFNQGTRTDNSLVAISRSSASGYQLRSNTTTTSITRTSQTPSSDNIWILRGATYGTHRIAFYSIGESLDLALLDARVTTLINAIAAAIP